MAGASVTINLAIPENEIQRTSILLGEGAYSSVYKAKWKGATVAVKCFNDRSVERSLFLSDGQASGEQTDVLSLFRREAHLMCGLLHPHIVRLFGVYAPGTRHVGLVMELMATSLHRRAIEDPALSLRRTTHILHDITSALAYLHERNILHRDVSPRNTLLTEDIAQDRYIAKLSDFATAKVVQTIGFDQHSSTSGNVGTYAYLPYEALDKDPLTGKLEYSSAVDVYSVGAVGLYTVLRKVPGATPKAKPAYLKLVSSDHVLYKLLSECLDDIPEKRPSSVALQAHLEGLLTSCESLAADESSDQEKIVTSGCLDCQCKDEEITRYVTELAEAEQRLLQNEGVISQLQTVLNQNQMDMSELNDALVAAHGVIAENEASIAEKDATPVQESSITRQHSIITEHSWAYAMAKEDQSLAEKQGTISKLKQDVWKKDALIDELRNTQELIEEQLFIEKVRAYDREPRRGVLSWFASSSTPDFPKWEAVKSPLPSDFDGACRSIVHGEHLYVSAYSISRGGLLWRTSNALAWHKLQPPSPTGRCNGLLSQDSHLYFLSAEVDCWIVIFEFMGVHVHKIDDNGYMHTVWQQLPNSRCPAIQLNPACFIDECESRIVIIGGTSDTERSTDSSSVVNEYCLRTKNWMNPTTWPKLPAPRVGLRPVYLHGHIHLFGGCFVTDTEFTPVSSVLSADISDNGSRAWQHDLIPAAPLRSCTACKIFGTIVVAGGWYSPSQSQEANVYTLDRKHSTWLRLPSLAKKNQPWLSLVHFQDQLLAFGGWTHQGWLPSLEKLSLSYFKAC